MSPVQLDELTDEEVVWLEHLQSKGAEIHGERHDDMVRDARWWGILIGGITFIAVDLLGDAVAHFIIKGA